MGKSPGVNPINKPYWYVSHKMGSGCLDPTSGRSLILKRGMLLPSIRNMCSVVSPSRTWRFNKIQCLCLLKILKVEGIYTIYDVFYMYIGFL